MEKAYEIEYLVRDKWGECKDALEVVAKNRGIAEEAAKNLLDQLPDSECEIIEIR
jgi:hypothetical protein